MTVTEHVRMLVRDRAKNRCEYCLCHQDYVMGRLRTDHVRPIAKGGVISVERLRFAFSLGIDVRPGLQPGEADRGIII